MWPSLSLTRLPLGFSSRKLPSLSFDLLKTLLKINQSLLGLTTYISILYAIVCHFNYLNCILYTPVCPLAYMSFVIQSVLYHNEV